MVLCTLDPLQQVTSEPLLFLKKATELRDTKGSWNGSQAGTQVLEQDPPWVHCASVRKLSGLPVTLMVTKRELRRPVPKPVTHLRPWPYYKKTYSTYGLEKVCLTNAQAL